MSDRRQARNKWKTKNRYVIALLLIFFVVCLSAGCKQEEKVDLQLVSEPIFIAEGIRSIQIVKQDKDMMKISYEPQDYEASFEYWKMSIPYYNEVVVDTEAMLMLYQQLVMMDMQKTPVFDEVEVDFEKPFGKIILNFCQTTQEERMAEVMGQDFDKNNSPSYQFLADSAATLLIGKSDGNGNYYVAYEGDESNVALLSEDMVDAVLDSTPFDYILKVSAVASRETIQRVILKFDNQSYEISEKQLEEQVYQTLYNELLSIFVVEEIPEMNEVDETILLSITLKRNVKEASNLHITYHPWDEEKYAVRVNEEAFFLVNSADVEILKVKIAEVFVVQ
jgi:hypothetical protein